MLVGPEKWQTENLFPVIVKNIVLWPGKFGVHVVIFIHPT